MPLTLPANPMFPMWFVLPLAAVAFAAIAGHLWSLRRAEMAWSRKRIRMANGVVMLGLAVLITYAVGFQEMLPSGGGSIGHIRAFVLVWMAIIGLVPLTLALAGLDVVNTIRLNRAAAREIRRRRQLEALRAVEIRVRARLGTPTGRGGEHHGG